MHYLYNTPLLKYMEDWLDSYDIDLLTTGVLALGNFARTDSHCIEMVKRNITTKLLGMYWNQCTDLHSAGLPHFELHGIREMIKMYSNRFLGFDFFGPYESPELYEPKVLAYGS